MIGELVRTILFGYAPLWEGVILLIPMVAYLVRLLVRNRKVLL